MSDKLKPCPFCGGEPFITDIEPHTHESGLAAFMPDHSGSSCVECGCGVGFVDEDREAATKRWNTRAALAQPQNDAEETGYAERLAVSLWEKHYKAAAPQWEPMTGDLIGILTQIDNMMVGLAPQKGADIAEPPEWLWWGKLNGKDVVTFGRWPKNGACWRYKLADIQPTEHDHTAPPSPERMREALFLFREFINHNVTQWQTGAGDHHHPIWGFIAEALGDENNRTRTQAEWRFIQPHNREALRAGDNHASDGKFCRCFDDRSRELCLDKDKCRPMAKAFAVDASDPTPPDREALWKHAKRGTIYRVLHDNAPMQEEQTEDRRLDDEPMVVYQDINSRAVYVRPVVEFYDGQRFLALRGGE